MKKLTYPCLIRIRQNALWAIETWFAQHHNFNTAGALTEALRYYRILNYIEDRMRNFKIAG